MQLNDWGHPQRVIELLKKNGLTMSFELAEQILMFMNSEMNVSSKDIEKNKIRGPTIEQLTGYFVKVYYEEILIDSLIPPKLVQ